MDEVEEGAWPMSQRGVWILYVGEATAFHAPICPALEQRGIDVLIGSSLADALDAPRLQPPACIVCDADFQEGLGLELAMAMRAHVDFRDVPLACISSDADRRVHALNAGADLALRTEIGVEAAAAQIAALVRLAGRIEAAPASQLTPVHGIAGDTQVAPLTTVLTALGHEKRSGVIELVADDEMAHLEIIDGQAVSGAIDGDRVEPLAALRAMLGWPDARFSFTALPIHGAPERAATLHYLCAEAIRLQDEETHARASEPAFARTA